MSTTFTHGTQNVLRKNSEQEIYADLDQAVRHAEIVGLQEVESPAAQKALKRIRARRDVAGYQPLGSAGAVPIIWLTETFRALKGHGSVRTYAGRARVSPSRHISWQPLLHLPTGASVLKINTHAVSGYASSPGQRGEAFRRESAQAHWLIMVETVSRLVRANDPDICLLGGDFNVRIENVGEWWYPGRLLEGLFDLSTAKHHSGIDPLLFTRSSSVKSLGRTSLRAHSDHRLRLHDLQVTA